MTAAIKRDAASGNGIELAIVTKQQYKKINSEDIEKRAAKLGL